MTSEELQRVRDWADAKLATGAEPPWAWQQLSRLRETIDGIIAGMEATQQTASLQESEERPATGLRLVVSTDRPDSAPRHPVGTPVRMPM